MPELIDLITSNFDYDNFFSAQLTAPMTASDTDIFLDAVPTPSEGVLVIDWDVAASREVIFYNSKTASKVTCPSVADGRGFDDSAATTHLSGANVIMAPVRAWFRLAQQLATTSEQGWKPLGYTPDSIVDNGNRSYTMVFNSVDLTSFISNGMRVKGTPTTAQPTRCADFESSSSQYYNKTSPAGTTFTDDFVVGAWVKLESYVAGAIASRYNGTSGWLLWVDATGAVATHGFNGGAANYSGFTTHQALPLNRWAHVAAQLDMSAFTNTPTTSYMMIDGADVPVALSRSGTNPTALIQAGNLEIGANNGGTLPFDGKMAQVFYTNAKVTQANVRLIKNQGITSATCSTYNIVSAYSFDNSINDINTTNANNLTAQGGVLATSADSPFGQNDAGVPGTSEWGIVMSRSFSTNTTIVIQVPEGSAWPTLPTSAAISSMSYSTNDIPFGFPLDKFRWELNYICNNQYFQNAAVNGTWYNVTGVTGVSGGTYLTVPVGNWKIGYAATTAITSAGSALIAILITLSTGSTTETDKTMSSRSVIAGTAAHNTEIDASHYREKPEKLTAQTPYYLNLKNDNSIGSVSIYLQGGSGSTKIFAIPDYL